MLTEKERSQIVRRIEFKKSRSQEMIEVTDDDLHLDFQAIAEATGSPIEEVIDASNDLYLRALWRHKWISIAIFLIAWIVMFSAIAFSIINQSSYRKHSLLYGLGFVVGCVVLSLSGIVAECSSRNLREAKALTTESDRQESKKDTES